MPTLQARICSSHRHVEMGTKFGGRSIGASTPAAHPDTSVRAFGNNQWALPSAIQCVPSATIIQHH
jgi:hypothetical protein